MGYIKFGDIMKSMITIFLSVVTAVLIGTLFIDTSSEPATKTMMGTYGNLTAFQVGAYNEIESANEISTKYEGIVIHDGDYYLVYVALLSNSLNIERMMQYLDENKIYYYVKTIDASEEFIEDLYKYEELMKQSSSNIAFMQLNKKILTIYGDEYAN